MKEVKHNGRMRRAFSVDALDENAACRVAADTLHIVPGEVAGCKRLPYPGEPRLNYSTGSAPSFCLQPDKCAGRSSCPRPMSCTE